MASLSDMIASDVSDVFLNTDDFAETVRFMSDSGPISATALIVMDEPIRDQDNETPTTFTGEIHIAESRFNTIKRDKTFPLTVIARGRKFNVTSVGLPEYGMVVIGIQAQDIQSGNAVGIDGKGIRYGRRSNEP